MVADLPSGLARGADVLLLRARAVGDGDVVDAPDAIARVMEESHTSSSTTSATTTTTAAESSEEGRDGSGSAGGGVRLLRALAPDGTDAFEIGASGATTVHAGGVDVRSGGVRVRAGGLEIAAGGLSVDGGLTLRSGALTLAEEDNGSDSDSDAQNGGGGGGGGNKAGGFVVRDGGVSARHTAPGAPPLRAHAASATFASAVLSLEAAPSASAGFSFIEVRRGRSVGAVCHRAVIARSL